LNRELFQRDIIFVEKQMFLNFSAPTERYLCQEMPSRWDGFGFFLLFLQRCHSAGAFFSTRDLHSSFIVHHSSFSMRFDIITVLPELLESPLNHSIMQRAKDKGLLEVYLHNLREYGLGKHRQVDDYQFGGGAGMVMRPEPLAACIEKLKGERSYDEIIYTSPDGVRLDQSLCNRLSLRENLLVICGHYKGVDERIRQKYVTLEISIGDYVLSGGELAAAVLVDAVGRLIPGVLNDETSALFDSFQDNLLAPPVYTRPAEWEGMAVPEILLSGNDKRIGEWRHEQSMERTKERRPDLWEKFESGV
jgi:tRNA (guanine37-N1)-methyltransferase